MTLEIRPVRHEQFADLGSLFESNSTTRGCWCLFFRIPRRDVQDGWGAGNRDRLETFVRSDDPPAGLLAYRDGEPVGWCAVGPRARFASAIGPRARILADRDRAEDEHVWLVPCFFVRVGARKAGTTRELLTAAVDLARTYGAPAVEGWPLAGDGPHKSDRYYGTEPLFNACGFSVVARPSAGRVVMRRSLG